MNLIDKYLCEDIFGRNRKRKQIYDKLEGNKKKEYKETVKSETDYYKKVSDALKSIKLSKYNLSTDKGWSEYRKDIKKELNKRIPNIFSDKHIINLTKDKISIAGWGKFNFNTEMDKWDYLTSVVMKIKGYIDPDNHKEWLNK